MEELKMEKSGGYGGRVIFFEAFDGRQKEGSAEG